MDKLKEKILELKKKKNAVIFAHHYAPCEIHELADVLSDSKGFFEPFKHEIDADNIIIVAPSFFAEIAACLLPDKTVISPIKSECPVANHKDLSYDKILEFRSGYYDMPLVCYGTSPLKTKVFADYVCIPGQVTKTIDSIDVPTVLFVGEKNSAKDAIEKCNKQVIEYPLNPVCNVYNSANASDVKKMKEKYPDGCLMVHPECKPEVIAEADYTIGTGDMYKIIKNNDQINTYILGVEMGFYERMKNEFPEKNILHLSPSLMCNAFKVFRRENILDALEGKGEVVQVDEGTARRISYLFNQAAF